LGGELLDGSNTFSFKLYSVADAVSIFFGELGEIGIILLLS
jgi:hypothetical protein